MAFGRGWIWPTGPAAPVAPAALTGLYAESTHEMEIGVERYLICVATLAAGGVEDPGLCVRVDVSFDVGVTWWLGYDYVQIPGYTVGDHRFLLELPQNCLARIACRDVVQDPDTTCQIYAAARMHPIMDREGGQPLLLEVAATDGVLAWHDGLGAAAALGLAYALGPPAPANPWWVPTGNATEAEILCTTVGATTSAMFLVEESCDEGVVVATPAAVNAVVAGVEQCMPRQIQIQSAAGALAAGTYASPRFPVNPGTWLRLQAQCTGAPVDCIAWIRLFRPGV